MARSQGQARAAMDSSGRRRPTLLRRTLRGMAVQPGEWQTTFTILTTSANRLLQPIHNRMPVILDEAGAADWMDGREPDPLSLKRLLMPAPDDLLVVRPAS